MTISVVLVIIAIVTLGVGWISGQDPMIYVSILSSVIAGLLLIKSVLDDRRARTAAALAGTSTISEASGYRPLEAEPISLREEPTLIGGEEEEEMEAEEAMGEMEPELATVGATRATRRGGATARRTTKPAASRAKTKTASRAKTSATRAKTSAKAKTAGTKARTAAKPKTGAARAKTTAKPKASTAKKSTAKKSTAKKSTAKKSTAKKSTARR